MTERPILFSAPMVRALAAGRKTQTRRVVKPAPPSYDAVKMLSGDGFTIFNDRSSLSGAHFRVGGPVWAVRQLVGEMANTGWVCPYGAPGDRLWVRETWRVGAWRDDGRVALDYAASPDLVRTPWLRPPVDVFRRLHVQGLADCRRALTRGVLPLEEHADGRFSWPHGGSPCRWRPSIHMPRWASRLTLEVTAVRVERLQAISEEDARAEGARRFDDLPSTHPYGQDARWSCVEPKSTEECLGSARMAFGNLWNSINGADSWASNPWVWVVTFKRVTP